MEKALTLYNWYIASHSGFDIFWTVANFFLSIAIVVLAYWRLNDVINNRISFDNKWDYVGVKASMVLICVGSLHHAFNLEPPSFWEGISYSGILLYLLLRRRKQLRDAKNS